MKVGLFFGSFNPIHIGHLILAESVLNEVGFDEVWFVVSPHNPFKEKRTLLSEFDRFYIVEIAISDNPCFRACNVEFNLPKPSYTIDTLNVLKSQYPTHQFSILIGEDNLVSLPKWRGYEEILDQFGVYVYPRLESGKSELEHKNIHRISAPIIEISATQIRDLFSKGLSARYLVPDMVLAYISSKGFYGGYN